mgnify:CR=1 FL=1
MKQTTKMTFEKSVQFGDKLEKGDALKLIKKIYALFCDYYSLT